MSVLHHERDICGNGLPFRTQKLSHRHMITTKKKINKDRNVYSRVDLCSSSIIYSLHAILLHVLRGACKIVYSEALVDYDACKVDQR